MDENVFRYVWNNIFLRRHILSQIRIITLKRGFGISEEEIRKGNYYNRWKEDIAIINNNPLQRTSYNGCLVVMNCPLLTSKLFKSYCTDFLLKRNKLKMNKGNANAYVEYYYALNEGILDELSTNQRHRVDIWLFKEAFYHLQSKGMMVNKMATYLTWMNAIKSNNIEFYNFVKQVLKPCQPPRDKYIEMIQISILQAMNQHIDIIPLPKGTEVLAALLDDVIEMDPLDTNLLSKVDFVLLAKYGCVDVLATLEKHAGKYIRRKITLAGYYFSASTNVRKIYRSAFLTDWVMSTAIRHKQIAFIRHLYFVSGLPILPLHLREATGTGDIKFIYEFHEMEPSAGRLYTIFLYAMSSNFETNTYYRLSHINWREFREAFIQLVRPLNFIDKRLEKQLENEGKIRYNIKRTGGHDQFKIFESDNIPSLTFDL